MGRPKITVVGAGNVGGTTAQRLAERDAYDVVLVDIVDGVPQGKALDISQAGPVCGYSTRVVGTNGYAETAGSAIAVITSGIPRKPGMSRDELLATNANIVKSVVSELVARSPELILILITNPLDAMVHVARKVSGLPKARIIGMAGVLDSARMRTFIAQALNVPGRDVEAMVLGGHGDTMVPVTGYCTIYGIPVAQLIPADKLAAIVERTRGGGGEIVKLMGTSAYYAPATAAIVMAESYLKDQKRLVPAAAYLDGEYGYKDLYMGVPVVIGAGGVEKIVDIQLTAEEKAMLDKSAAAVRELIEASKKL